MYLATLTEVLSRDFHSQEKNFYLFFFYYTQRSYLKAAITTSNIWLHIVKPLEYSELYDIRVYIRRGSSA